MYVLLRYEVFSLGGKHVVQLESAAETAKTGCMGDQRTVG